MISQRNASQEVKQALLPIIFSQNNLQLSEVANINSWLLVAANRSMALSLMARMLDEHATACVLGHAVSWLTVTSQISAMGHESESVRALASYNFCKLLKHCSQVSEVAREISANHIPAFFQELLSNDLPDPSPCLQCFKVMMKCCPRPCVSFRGKLIKYVLPFLTSLNSSVQDLAVRCWCLIPVVGGGGTQGRNYAQQWQTQCKELIDTMSFTCTKLFESVSSDELVDPSAQCLSLPFPSLPVKEPDLTHSLLQRFISLCKCMKCLLENKHIEVAVDLPIHSIMDVLQMCFDVTPKSMGYTSEKLLRARYLSNLHQACMEVLNALTQSCHQYMCRYTTTILQIYLNLLNLWRDPAPSYGRRRKHCSIRADIYAAISLCIQCCGTRFQFLCGESHVTRATLDHIIKDITPTADNMQVNTNDFVTSSKGKKRKRSVTPFDHDRNLEVNKICDNKANSEVCRNALKVARLSVLESGPLLRSFVHKLLQETIITLLLQLNNGRRPVIPYERSVLARRELYHLLLALTVSPSPAWPAPLHLALTFFQHGACTDKNLEIRTWCREAGRTISHITRPPAPTLHRPSATFTRECMKKSDCENPCYEVNVSTSTSASSCDTHVRFAADAHTSTDDLIEFIDKSMETDRIISTQDMLSSDDAKSLVEAVRHQGNGDIISKTSKDRVSNDEKHCVKRRGIVGEAMVGDGCCHGERKRQKVEAIVDKNDVPMNRKISSDPTSLTLDEMLADFVTYS